MWLAFQMLLSFSVVLVGVSVFVVAAREDGVATVLPWYALAISIFVATTPWVFGQTQYTRAFGLAGIFLGIGVTYFGFSNTYLPEDCSEIRRRGALVCYALNWVYALGGAGAVSVVWVSFGGFLLIGSYLFLKRRLYNV